MNIKILDPFRLLHEKEEFGVVKGNIEKDCVFRGTNLWILIFAILIASLGLNMNSTAVVIGAMLISPLMGPILGVGAGVALNDLPLIRKASFNYGFALVVGLLTSTLYFLLSPIDDAHSEILARTLPTIYDVLIAFFGGFAGIIAISSKQKGNVIAGAAIATALMPPLCTAGYGLATLQWQYFLGAFYLYLINSVFIAVATIITAYLLKFPAKKYTDHKIEKREKGIIWAIIILTLIPSLYLGYDIVQQKKFNDKSNQFIESEALLPNDYLLKKEIDAKNKKITLTFGGKEIKEEEINDLKSKLKYYGLEGIELEVKQGFAFLEAPKRNEEQVNQMGLALKKTEEDRKLLKSKLDSIHNQQSIGIQIFKELKTQYPDLRSAVIQPVLSNTDTLQTPNTVFLVLLDLDNDLEEDAQVKLENWLKVRLRKETIRLVILPNTDKQRKKRR
jgi:uncharacterized hydrophobic protein (TIGR00271 family)